MLECTAANSAEALLSSYFQAQRLPKDLADTYAVSLVHLGYDDLQSLAEDASEEELLSAGLKPGHAKRILKQLQLEQNRNAPRLSSRSTAPLSTASSDSSRVIRCRRCQVICVDELGRESTFWVEPGHEGEVQLSTANTTPVMQQIPVSIHSLQSRTPEAEHYITVRSPPHSVESKLGSSCDYDEAELKHEQQQRAAFGNGKLQCDSMASVNIDDANAIEDESELLRSQAVDGSCSGISGIGLNNSASDVLLTDRSIPYDILHGDPLEWGVPQVLKWLQSFEALRAQKYVNSFQESGINGKCLLGITSEADAEEFGIVFRPHKLQLLREIASLRLKSRDITMGNDDYDSSIYESNSNSDHDDIHDNSAINDECDSISDTASSIGIYERRKEDNDANNSNELHDADVNEVIDEDEILSNNSKQKHDDKHDNMIDRHKRHHSNHSNRSDSKIDVLQWPWAETLTSYKDNDTGVNKATPQSNKAHHDGWSDDDTKTIEHVTNNTNTNKMVVIDKHTASEPSIDTQQQQQQPRRRRMTDLMLPAPLDNPKKHDNSMMMLSVDELQTPASVLSNASNNNVSSAPLSVTALSDSAISSNIDICIDYSVCLSSPATTMSNNESSPAQTAAANHTTNTRNSTGVNNNTNRVRASSSTSNSNHDNSMFTVGNGVTPKKPPHTPSASRTSYTTTSSGIHVYDNTTNNTSANTNITASATPTSSATASRRGRSGSLSLGSRLTHNTAAYSSSNSNSNSVWGTPKNSSNYMNDIGRMNQIANEATPKVNQAHGRRGAQHNSIGNAINNTSTLNNSSSKKEYIGHGHVKTIQRIREGSLSFFDINSSGSPSSPEQQTSMMNNANNNNQQPQQQFILDDIDIDNISGNIKASSLNDSTSRKHHSSSSNRRSRRSSKLTNEKQSKDQSNVNTGISTFDSDYIVNIRDVHNVDNAYNNNELALDVGGESTSDIANNSGDLNKSTVSVISDDHSIGGTLHFGDFVVNKHGMVSTNVNANNNNNNQLVHHKQQTHDNNDGDAMVNMPANHDGIDKHIKNSSSNVDGNNNHSISPLHTATNDRDSISRGKNKGRSNSNSDSSNNRQSLQSPNDNINHINNSVQNDNNVGSVMIGHIPLSTVTVTVTPKRMRETTILLDEIGKGAGGTVYRAIHVPSMKLVAVKSVIVHDEDLMCGNNKQTSSHNSSNNANATANNTSSNRQQIARELRALHSINMVALPTSYRNNISTSSTPRHSSRSSTTPTHQTSAHPSPRSISSNENDSSDNDTSNLNNNSNDDINSSDARRIFSDMFDSGHSQHMLYGDTSVSTHDNIDNKRAKSAGNYPSNTVSSSIDYYEDNSNTVPKRRSSVQSESLITDTNSLLLNDVSMSPSSNSSVHTHQQQRPKSTTATSLRKLWGDRSSSINATNNNNDIINNNNTDTNSRKSRNRSFSAGRLTSYNNNSKDKNTTGTKDTNSSINKACPHIVAFHDAYTDSEKGCVCMVMEYMDAGTLQQFVHDKRQCDEETLAAVARSVLKALSTMHTNHQIHRDIKPSNILLDRKGHVKIGDFGVSKELGATSSLAMTFTGTLTYMSPERINSETYSYPSDIWSLGLVIVTLALGFFPLRTQGGYWAVVQAIQEGPPPLLSILTSNNIDNKYAPDLCDFVDSMVKRDPKQRPTAKQLLKHPFLKRLRGCRRIPIHAIHNIQPVNNNKCAAIMEDVVRYRLKQRLLELQQEKTSTSSIIGTSASTAAGSSTYQYDGYGHNNTVDALCLPVLDIAQAKGLAKQLGCEPKVLVEAHERFVNMYENEWMRGELDVYSIIGNSAASKNSCRNISSSSSSRNNHNTYMYNSEGHVNHQDRERTRESRSSLSSRATPRSSKKVSASIDPANEETPIRRRSSRREEETKD